MSNLNDPDNAERQAAEIALLKAMYPSEFKWDNNTSTEVGLFSKKLIDAVVTEFLYTNSGCDHVAFCPSKGIS
jgi:hypothetical protein